MTPREIGSRLQSKIKARIDEAILSLDPEIRELVSGIASEETESFVQDVVENASKSEWNIYSDQSNTVVMSVALFPFEDKGSFNIKLDDQWIADEGNREQLEPTRLALQATLDRIRQQQERADLN